MYKGYEITEVTKDNESQYLHDIAELEELVLDRMQQEGRNGQLFITGQEGISEYVNSDSNHVMVAVGNDDKKLISAVYITQGQVDFTYNDITKYFKCDDDYKEYIKSKYTKSEFNRMIREIYIEKIQAFRYARDMILSQKGEISLERLSEDERNIIFMSKVTQERNNPENQFHEKSEIRDDLNKYMTLYMTKVKNDLHRYQQFYWVDFNYLKENLGLRQSEQQGEYSIDSTISTCDRLIYDKVLSYQKYKIYDTEHCSNMSKYYNANTANTIELDTYITHPSNRENGIARILVFEGIKKSIQRVLRNPDNSEIFLASTLHEENLSSKYVSDFFGLTDYLFVNRRNGRDRQVHICKIKREDVSNYLEKMEKKIAVLYGYNPRNIRISQNERNAIIEEQLNYEIQELSRLNSIKDVDKAKKFTGYIKGKKSKIEKLRGLLSEVQKSKKCEVSQDVQPIGNNQDNSAPEL